MMTERTELALQCPNLLTLNRNIDMKQNRITEAEITTSSPAIAKQVLPAAKFVHISKSWVTRNSDGSLKDFGIRIIKHRESFCQWNDEKNDWDYFSRHCHCEICQEAKPQPEQLSLFGCR